MSLLNEILAARFNRQISRLLNMGGEPPAPQLSSDVQPMLDILAPDLELAYLRDERLCGGAVDYGPSALVASSVKLINPLASGALAIVELAELANFEGVTRVVQLCLTTDLNFDAGTGGWGLRDPRYFGAAAWGTAAGTTCTVRGYNAALPVRTVLANVALEAFGHSQYRWPAVVPPGFALQANSVAINAQIGGSFHWRERALTDREV